MSKFFEEYKFFLWILALEILYFRGSDTLRAAQLLTSAFQSLPISSVWLMSQICIKINWMWLSWISFWKRIMSLELLTPCVCVSPALILLSAEGHANMELHQLSMPAPSTYYQDTPWTRTKDPYSLIWQAWEFELQREIQICTIGKLPLNFWNSFCFLISAL